MPIGIGVADVSLGAFLLDDIPESRRLSRKPPSETIVSHILHLAWENSSGFGTFADAFPVGMLSDYE
jgi:hypothetical protein